MIDFNLRSRKQRTDLDELAAERAGDRVSRHPRFSHATFGLSAAAVTGLVGAAGVGASLYGANQQKKSNQSAQDQNAALQKQTNDSAWANWLMTRGITPTTPVAAGTMPTAGNYTANNTRLPLWATMQRPAAAGAGSPGRWVKKGGAA